MDGIIFFIVAVTIVGYVIYRNIKQSKADVKAHPEKYYVSLGGTIPNPPTH